MSRGGHPLPSASLSSANHVTVILLTCGPTPKQQAQNQSTSAAPQVDPPGDEERCVTIAHSFVLVGTLLNQRAHHLKVPFLLLAMKAGVVPSFLASSWSAPFSASWRVRAAQRHAHQVRHRVTCNSSGSWCLDRARCLCRGASVQSKGSQQGGTTVAQRRWRHFHTWRFIGLQVR